MTIMDCISCTSNNMLIKWSFEKWAPLLEQLVVGVLYKIYYVTFYTMKYEIKLSPFVWKLPINKNTHTPHSVVLVLCSEFSQHIPTMAICKRSHLCQTIVLGIHVKFWERGMCVIPDLDGYFPLSFPLRGWYGPGLSGSWDWKLVDSPIPGQILMYFWANYSNYQKWIRPWKINIELENNGLEDDFPFLGVYSQVPC